MKTSHLIIKVSVMSFAMALSILAVAVSDDRVSFYEKSLDDVVSNIKACKGVDVVHVSKLCHEVSRGMDRNMALKLLREFEERIFAVDISKMSFREQLSMSYMVWNAAWGLWGAIPVSSDKERWEIRLKALEWKKKQLDRLLASPPEDNRPWSEKWQNPRAPRDSEKGQWEDAVFRFKSCFYKSDLRICVQAAEEERYSEEFRAWCFKEIEKIIGRPLTDDDIMFKEDVLRRRAKRLIDRIPSSWEESVEAFTNVAYKACEAISKIDNPTKRLECAIAYGESLFKLDRFVRECDVQGYWARINAHGMAKDILHELDVESKWIHAAKYRQLMKEELKYYEPLGSSTPMRMLKRNRWNEKEYEVLSKENERRREALKYRSFANQIRMSLKNHYKPIFEWGLKEDCYNLSPERKESLLKMIIEITGETPKWYQEELEENRKTPSTVAK
jgi:hypothetical protein